MHLPQHLVLTEVLVCIMSIAIGVAIAKRTPIVYLLSTALINVVLNDWTKYYVGSADSKQTWHLLTIAISMLGSILWLVAWFRSSKKEM